MQTSNRPYQKESRAVYRAYRDRVILVKPHVISGAQISYSNLFDSGWIIDNILTVTVLSQGVKYP